MLSRQAEGLASDSGSQAICSFPSLDFLQNLRNCRMTLYVGTRLLYDQHVLMSLSYIFIK